MSHISQQIFKRAEEAKWKELNKAAGQEAQRWIIEVNVPRAIIISDM